METLILFGKIMALSLLVTLICVGGFYCGFRLVNIFLGDK